MKLLLRCGFIAQGICVVLIAGTLHSDTQRYWLAYTDYGRGTFPLYRANPDGSNFQHMADGEAQAWSPDGRWVIFDGPSGQLFRMRWDGHLEQQLTDSGETKLAVQYSPDGEWIVFVTDQDRVFRMRTDGSEQQVIVQDSSLSSHNPPTVPNWSPDSQWLVFAQRETEGHESRIYLMRPDGSDRQVIAEGRDPSWSPDGSWIAFGCGEITPNICRISAEEALRGEGQPELWLEDASGLTWSADGQWVAFLRSVPADEFRFSHEDSRVTIFRVHVDSSMPEEVTRDTGHAHQPNWSPDGQWIAFEHNWEMTRTIARIRPDGSGLQTLTPRRIGSPYSPLWSPPVTTSFGAGPVIGIGLVFVIIGFVPWSQIRAYFRRQPRQSRVH